jgi:DNA oxidative demethylase
MTQFGSEMEGFCLYKAFLSSFDQRHLIEQVQGIIKQAPLFQPTMPRTGRPFSVHMTNMGPLGWVSDKAGYRYQAQHPDTAEPWPPIPQNLLDLWHQVTSSKFLPEACLINVYDRPKARMGQHVDGDEDDMTAPIVSVSLGNNVIFRIGGLKRSDPTQSIELETGDVIVMGGLSRRAYHGIDRVKPDTSDLWPGGGRINLTLRRVSKPQVTGP